jgi:type IV pilus assembly protein PilE
VIGILAAVGIPYYNDYVVRSKINEATSALVDSRVKMEQFFQDNRSYASASLAANGCPTAFPATLPPRANGTYFSYACSNLSATTYTITATGLSTMAPWTFTINQDNTRTTANGPSGWAPGGGWPASCWIRRKGSC